VSDPLVHFPSDHVGLTWCGLAIDIPRGAPITDDAQQSADGLLFATNMPIVTCPGCDAAEPVYPLAFADHLSPRSGFTITVPHDYTGDVDGIRDYVAEHLTARLGEPVTVRVERDPPPPGEHEPRVTVTSGRGAAIAAMMDAGWAAYRGHVEAEARVAREASVALVAPSAGSRGTQ
jgi:hypothetical protein